MNIIKPVIFSLVLSLTPFSVSAENKGKAITQDFGYEYSLDSKVLAESRQYLVHLPESYKDSDKTYPVIYALDGPSHFKHIVSAMKILHANDRMPEAIIVGIPNNPGTRGRDLSRNNDQFLNFLENELVPLIDNQYRTSSVNTLFGHSLAGYFTFHTMLNGSRFTNFIAASPHIIANTSDIKSGLETMIKNNKHTGKSIYFTMADAQGDGAGRVKSVETLSEYLGKEKADGLAWKYQPIDQQEHMTTPYLTAFKGLTCVFTDFQTPMFADVKEFTAKGGMAAVTQHYKDRSKKYGAENKVAQRVIRQIAGLYMDEKKMDKAIELLSKSVNDNPTSMRAHFDLARGYQEKGDTSLAIKFYQQTQKLLQPEHGGFARFITTQLTELESNKS